MFYASNLCTEYGRYQTIYLFQIYINNTLPSTIKLPQVTHIFLIIPFRAVRPTKHTAFIWRSWYYSVQQYILRSVLRHFLPRAAIISLLVLSIPHFTLLSNNLKNNEYSQKKYLLNNLCSKNIFPLSYFNLQFKDKNYCLFLHWRKILDSRQPFALLYVPQGWIDFSKN